MSICWQRETKIALRPAQLPTDRRISIKRYLNMVVALYFNYPCEKVLHYIYQFIFKDSIEMGSCF